jgi:hypothetical protein
MPTYCNVVPRFTAGSPAMVDRQTAVAVARDERQGYERARTGVYGHAEQEKVETLGVRGIVEDVRELAGCWEVHDALTDERFIRPFEVYGETPLREGKRLARLRAKYGLPLEADLEGGRRGRA